MIKVGIDAKMLSKPLTGIGRYLQSLSSHLVQKPGAFHFYSHSPFVVPQAKGAVIDAKYAQVNHPVMQLLWSQSKLPLWAKQDNVDVFWGPAHRLPRLLPKKMKKIVTIHDLGYIYAKETMDISRYYSERWLLPQALDIADVIVAVSTSTANDIIALQPKVESKVKVLHSGTPTLPRPLSKDRLAAMGIDKPFFIFVGTLEPRKNLDRLLLAFSKLSKDIQSTHDLVIAGGKGWGGVQVEALIKRYHLAGKVKVLGYIDDVQLSTLYAYAQFLAMPSRYEGFGFPLLESLSFNTPVLTSNNSSMPEVAGQASLLVDPIDVQDMVEKLTQMFDPQIYQDLVHTAKSQPRPFCWEKTANEFWSIIQSVVSS